jgi:predicted protein tyrosine phosphatase
MAKSLMLVRNSHSFLQSPSFNSFDSSKEGLKFNSSETSTICNFGNSKLNSKLTIDTHAIGSHLGLSLHDLDSLSSKENPVSENAIGGFRLAVNKDPHPVIQSSERKSFFNVCCTESSNHSTKTDSISSALSESKPGESAKHASAVTPTELVTLMNNREFLLLLDCRTFMAFNSNHINGALNVSCSDRITKKRLADGKITVADIVGGQEAKEIYRRLEGTADIILYDENTVDRDSIPETNSLSLLSKSLLKHGKQSKYLQGGLQAFQECYSFMCSQPDSSAGVPLLYSPTSPEINCDIDTAVASEILPYLFIGNQRDSANRDQLNELGITHILNVTSHLPLHFENDGITYKRLAATDSGSQNLKQYFTEAISFIECARKSNGKVLVHCQAGVSRSPSIVAAYLIATSYKSLTEAFTVIKDQRPIVAPNINFMGQLLEFEQQLVPRSGLCPPPEPVHLL